MDQWEYHVVARVTAGSQSWRWLDKRIDDPAGSGEDVLNNLGQQGWELVTVVCVPRGSGSAELHYFLKRPKKK